MKRKGRFLSGTFLFLPLLTLSLGLLPTISFAATPPATISIGTHRVGLSYHAAGVGIAKVVSEKSAIKVLVKPFAGPNAWMPLLDSGELELGLLSGMDAGWAFTKGPGYSRKNANLRVLMKGNMVNVIIITRASSDIRKIQDLRGHSLTSDYGGNAIVKHILEVYLASGGLEWKDVKNVPVPDVASGLQSLREARVDAAFGGAPDTVRELDAAISIRPVPLDSTQKALAKAREILPSARPVLIKKGTAVLKEDTMAIGYPNYLAASSKLSEGAAYEVVKALWENYKELHPVHPWLKGWVREEMFDPDPPAPYHPGAVKFYKEKGLWNAEAEKNQKELGVVNK